MTVNMFKDKDGKFMTRRLLFIIPIVLFTLDGTTEDVRFDWYQGLAAAVTAYIIVYNFPFIISGMHSKPKYIEDIISEYELTDKKKNYYKQIFEYAVGALSSIVLGGLVYNTLSSNNEITGWLNLAGIIGGIASLYGKFLKFAGKTFLSVLDYLKRRKERNISTNQTDIAMKDITRVASASDLEEGKLAPDHLIKSQLSNKSLKAGRSRSNTPLTAP